MLGIGIGIASVTAILTLAAGVTNSVNQQVADVGGDIAIIRPGASGSSQISTVLNPQLYSTSTLNEPDLAIIRQAAPEVAVAPLMQLDITARSNDTTLEGSSIIATTPELPKTTSLALSDGQFIDTDTSIETAVLGNQLSIDLFGTNNAIGKTFYIRDQRFTVIGVLKPINDPINYNNIDFNTSAIIHLQAGRDLHRGNTQIQQINIRAESPEKLTLAIKNIDSQLAKSHGERDFHILSGHDIATPTNSLYDIVARTMTAIATISLVVGGIGVMNIMLVSVAERTREIGIRKSVGASNRNIIAQFLAESILVSIFGGLLGATAGVVLAFVIGVSMYVTPVFSWQTGAVAFCISLGIGILFGLYPAIRAARKDPIESLRQYR